MEKLDDSFRQRTNKIVSAIRDPRNAHAFATEEVVDIVHYLPGGRKRKAHEIKGQPADESEIKHTATLMVSVRTKLNLEQTLRSSVY